MRIQLLTFPGCANADAARELLSSVLASSGAVPVPEFEEVDTHSAEEPYRSYASPTILVDGVAIGGSAPRDGSCCRLYVDESGRRLAGVPSETALRAALAGAVRTPHAAAT